MAIINNVRLVFQPAGAPTSEAVPAANQHVYLDLQPGTMAHVRSNAQGTIVGAAPGASVSLDDTRSYHIVVSPNALAPEPSSTQGTIVWVTGGRITVVPHIAIHVTGTAGSNLACVLTVGTSSRNVTTSAGGWIISNDFSAGAVTLRTSATTPASTKLLKLATAPDPQPAFVLTPAQPIRGSSATIEVRPPAGSVGPKVTEWQYEISHTNPGSHAALNATVTRPADESPTQSWQGVLCAAGTLRITFIVGVTVRDTGNAAVAVAVLARDPLQVAHPIPVAARTGASWESHLVQNPMGSFTRPINQGGDVGSHTWLANDWSWQASPLIPVGPNKGCVYLTALSLTFTSTPRINTHLSNTTSAFSQAQDKAYLVRPTPVRVIPRNLYTVGAGGVITLTNLTAFSAHFDIRPGVQYEASPHCIDQPRLLAGTRRHESEATDGRSHKGNCLKALRALEPVKFAEALVQLPGAQVDFQNLIQGRVDLVRGEEVWNTHQVIDEARTRTDQQVRYTGQTILDCNAADAGQLIGPVWNPVTNSRLTNPD